MHYKMELVEIHFMIIMDLLESGHLKSKQILIYFSIFFHKSVYSGINFEENKNLIQF